VVAHGQTLETMNLTVKTPQGRLEWRWLLHGLHEDGLLSDDEAARIRARFGAGDSSQHPLIRLGGADLVDARNGRALDVEALLEWLAGRLAMPYLRSTRWWYGQVADVMSIRCRDAPALPMPVGATEVTVAACGLAGWCPDQARTRKRRLVLAIRRGAALHDGVHRRPVRRRPGVVTGRWPATRQLVEWAGAKRSTPTTV
jgi:hypothetical protein